MHTKVCLISSDIVLRNTRAKVVKKIQPAKTAAIEAAKKTFADYNDFIFADYRGMTVEQITQLRRKLREQSAVLKVVKNNFARIAFADMKIDNVADYLKGPTVVAMVKEDSNEVAKTLFDFSKDAPTLNVKGGFIGKEIYDAAKISEFRLPRRISEHPVKHLHRPLFCRRTPAASLRAGGQVR